MFLYINNIVKGLSSIILIYFAYHFFFLGATNISKLIEHQKKIKVAKEIKSEDIKEKIFTKKLEKIEETSDKLTGIDKIFIDPSTIQEELPDTKIITKENIIKVEKGDTLSLILNKQPIEKKYIQKIIDEIGKIFNLKKLKIGQQIIFDYKYNANNQMVLEKIKIPLSFKDEILIEKKEGNFIAKNITLPISVERKLINVNIEQSIFESGKKANVPSAILMDLIRLYSFDVDFQRDIRKEDSYAIFYEIFYNEKRREVAYGDIIYANLILQGKEIEYFIFETEDGFDYFNRQGNNVRKALMKTPLDGARLSSGYGMRKHPILGYDLMHKGLDFAAPRGTPVFAAGNGTVEYAGTNGSYGKYIRIRHNNSYKTAYAHLNGYSKGISAGKRVKQAQIIGYVGSTGRSTGPHLHYEVIFNGEKINPMTMKLPSGKKLKNEELENFIKYSSQIYSDVLKKMN